MASDQHVDESIDLPPGFRFHPTDEEIITHYLSPKALSPSFTSSAIGDVDLNKSEPWDLPSKAKMGEKEWYFFCQRDRKYPTGMRTNRATEAGYWKATGKDKEIFRGRGVGVLVGMKKTLVFYTGRAPKGDKTNWVMHEFRLEGKPIHPNLPRAAKNEWVVCKVFNKDMGGAKKSPMEGVGIGEDLMCSSSSLPALKDPPCFNSYAGGGDIKGMITASSPLPSYFSTMGGLQEPNESGLVYPQFPPQTPYFPLPRIPSLGYLHQGEAMLSSLAATTDVSAAIRRHCKGEQFSTSQDTGLSTDRNTEISSKNTGGGYDLDNLNSVEDAIDLDTFWIFQ